MSSPNRQDRRHGRRLATTRLLWAGALFVAPRQLLRLAGGTADPAALKVARVLGGRHALQGAVELASWPRGRRLGAAVDGLHALTALALAGLDPKRRRVALSDALVAGTFAADGLRR